MKRSPKKSFSGKSTYVQAQGMRVSEGPKNGRAREVCQCGRLCHRQMPSVDDSVTELHKGTTKSFQGREREANDRNGKTPELIERGQSKVFIASFHYLGIPRPSEAPLRNASAY
ncbi:Hypothetical protein NTJ_01632 [Nesidiocoris tenuis]|uniref:Uncharacterized protein n=1 Tax=Nesidiocoris tenuis TaxID=355587 RepID=A0ABN7A945_9HEMI|nr:Hypothetical protein NTJ_01632 [Nesidiocoris tenuis]